MLDDEFDTDEPPCDPWGDRFQDLGNTLVKVDGELQLAPRAPGAAGCVSKTTFGFPRGGLIAEVTEVVDVPGAYTSVGAGDDDSIQAINGELFYKTRSTATQYSKVPFDPETMRWWRLHDEQGMLTASYSANGITDWVVFGQRSAPTPTNITISLFVGLYQDVPDVTGATRFGRLLHCE